MGEDERTRSARKAKAYSELILTVARGAELEELGPIAARVLLEELESDGASITSRKQGEVRYVGVAGTAAVLEGRRLRLEESFTGRVLREGRGRIFDPDVAPSDSRERASHDGIQSGMVAPIVVEGQVVGTAGVTALREGAYGPAELRLLDDFAAVLAKGVLKKASG